MYLFMSRYKEVFVTNEESNAVDVFTIYLTIFTVADHGMHILLTTNRSQNI